MSAIGNARRVLVALALIASACGTTPSVAPSATETALPTATALTPTLDHTWLLDFRRSGLSDRVPGCGPCSLGSSLTFFKGEVSLASRARETGGFTLTMPGRRSCVTSAGSR